MLVIPILVLLIVVYLDWKIYGEEFTASRWLSLGIMFLVFMIFVFERWIGYMIFIWARFWYKKQKYLYEHEVFKKHGKLPKRERKNLKVSRDNL